MLVVGVVCRSYHGFGRGWDGGSWQRAWGAQPGGVGYVTGDARALPVCEVGTLLTHDGTDVESNLCVAE